MKPKARQRKEAERPAVKERGQVEREKARDLAGSTEERNSRERTGRKPQEPDTALGEAEAGQRCKGVGAALAGSVNHRL